MLARFALALPLVLMLLVPAARAQTASGPVRLFLDCQDTDCDDDFLRTEVKFVDYVRDRADADVHVIVTTQRNGSGGDTYTLRFLGQARFDGVNDELTFATSQTDTDDAERRALARTLAAGLVRYAARAGGLANLTIGYTAPAGSASSPTAEARDVWNRWIFRLSARGFTNGEKRYTNSNVFLNASANRTTERLKTRVSAFGSRSLNRFVIDSVTTSRNAQRSLGASAGLVYSLAPRISAALDANVNSATFSNTDLRVSLSPGVEYSVFPYAESTSRLFTLRYRITPQFVDYRAETIFSKTEEFLVNQGVEANLALKQPWGQVDFSAEAGHYLHDASKYRLSFYTGLELQLIRGLSLDLNANYARIRDQLNIERGEESDEDILLRRRQLGTGYSYFASVGLSYTFGSIFNDVVNPRFGGGGGGRSFSFNN